MGPGFRRDDEGYLITSAAISIYSHVLSRE